MKTQVPARAELSTVPIERVQTGIRLEKRLVKVLKAVAELRDLTLGELIEGISLHALEGSAPFSAETRQRIVEFRRSYGLELTAADAHRLMESDQ